MYCTVIKLDGHLRTRGKCRKDKPEASVFYISRVSIVHSLAEATENDLEPLIDILKMVESSHLPNATAISNMVEFSRLIMILNKMRSLQSSVLS